MIQQENAF